MGEISTAILGIFGTVADHRDYFGMSSISLCPRKTYLNYQLFKRWHETGQVEEVIPAQRKLLMDDGHYQEAQVVDLLNRAGFRTAKTGKDQLELTVGRSGIKGHSDGLISSDGVNWRLLEIKARNYQAFKEFEANGLKTFPDIRVQTQLYMASPDLPVPIDEVDVVFKHKESVTILDKRFKKDEEFAGKVIESVDSIFVDGVIPEPELTELCKGCKFETLCWTDPNIDFSGFTFEEMSDADDKWIRGKAAEELGKILLEEARVEFLKALGDKEELMTDSLKIRRNEFPRRTFDTKRYEKEMGEDEFNKWCNFTMVQAVKVTHL